MPAQALHSAEISFHADTTNASSMLYFFKLVLYKEKGLTEPDAITASLNFGDGTTAHVDRTSRTLLSANANIYRDVYYFKHQFSAPGNFTVSFRYINRLIDYLNIPGSENIAFGLQANVKVDLTATGNHSPVFLAPPITTAILGQPFRHNITAYDPDGDSVAYKLVPAFQQKNQPVLSYEFPEGATINTRTGEFSWPNPKRAGRHGVVIEVREYRQGVLIGTVMRDFSVIVGPSGMNPVLQIQNRNQVPVITQNQLFITAMNTPVKIRITASRAGSLAAYSELFRNENVITARVMADNPPEIEYTITPTPALQRSLPYIITFRGTSATVTADIAAQQDLTLAVYFRPERVINQQNTTEGGERDILTSSPEPDDAGSLVFNIYPNPVHTDFKVDNNSKLPAKLLLYNASSRLVLVQALRLKQTHIKRPSGLRAGIYYYIILAGQEKKIARTGKLLVW
ncbi:hypothetical protein AAE02nite_28970 [Adhaeribacter aerolatus]|uniref:Secretion system C-terminal sorting domain-containing protein n=1 Tax=Adhaeribacter aerolatus TaxID=670289 RepID=A0A512AZT8_9BACT|nr:hypothetical protein AAE02nite_28970 [Adhaeribacter aerolatus]